MEIKNNLFDLTEEQSNMSKTMYNGKIIKCLIAPYHSYNELEKIVEYTPTTLLFPEREVSATQLSGLISSIVYNQNITEEIRIITTNQSIILDMIDSSVRVLSESGKVKDCPIKTFMANIHDIRYKIFENKLFRDGKDETNYSKDRINDIITEINSLKTISNDKYNELKEKISTIGEDIIRNKLMSMLNYIKK